ncbi:MAG: aminoglycoside 3'-phosphotransferase [Acholeplasma sp.]|jgi:kanamycin kinase/aminoglycoside 3'-phosphotransferase-3|nr:MAG: aminoglycoside 3'-phosphotransferase [Acholeplasma sp.]
MEDRGDDMPRYPKAIHTLISNLHWTKDTIGMGNSHVRLFIEKPWVLKIFHDCDQGHREIALLRWLDEQKIPVPKIIETAEDKKYVYLLMTKLEGLMSCDPMMVKKPEMVIDLLADGIKRLQRINIQDCPFSLTIKDRLKIAKTYLEKGEVDMDTWDTDIIKGRFQTPQELYTYLENHQPKEDLVFVHGDYCLPNIFIKEDTLSGFLDLGLAGIADKHLDLAICMRSIKYNFETDQHKELFFSKFDFVVDEKKIDYYLLLDELF